MDYKKQRLELADPLVAQAFFLQLELARFLSESARGAAAGSQGVHDGVALDVVATADVGTVADLKRKTSQI